MEIAAAAGNPRNLTQILLLYLPNRTKALKYWGESNTHCHTQGMKKKLLQLRKEYRKEPLLLGVGRSSFRARTSPGRGQKRWEQHSLRLRNRAPLWECLNRMTENTSPLPTTSQDQANNQQVTNNQTVLRDLQECGERLSWRQNSRDYWKLRIEKTLRKTC